MWEVEYTDEFGLWWDELADSEHISIKGYIDLLKLYGTKLKFPYCSGIQGSKHHHMRELRVQHKGEPYRILYAFDPNRTAICLVGGQKTGDDRWYKKFVPIADKLYDEHLRVLRKEKSFHETH
jgi:hypothetical protein